MTKQRTAYGGPALWAFLVFVVLGAGALILYDRVQHPHRGEPGRCIVCGEPATHSLVQPGQAAPLQGVLCLKHATERHDATLREGADTTPIAILFVCGIVSMLVGGWAHGAFMRRAARGDGVPPA